mmetsp:Transcript_33705/g.54273  ORF Transcript_33705/g.54273 Transcript_33705/m.54273 type:complete len:222 (-) Transcript_33705:395-1060(-)
MLFAAFLSFTGIILQTIPVVAISEDREPRKSAAWITADATVNGTEGKLWLALSGIELDQFEEIRSVDWDSNTCSVTIDQDACEKCRDASESSYSTALLSLITAVPQFLTDIQRSTPEGDLNCQKFFGIATGIIGFFGTITAITSYIQDCRDNLPDRFAGTDEEIDYDLDPALVCLTIATFLKVIDVIVHAMMPVPVRDHVSQGSEVSENVQVSEVKMKTGR